MNGEVIPGLYCGGESAGGFSQHGVARAACQGYIAGRAAAPHTSLPSLKLTSWFANTATRTYPVADPSSLSSSRRYQPF